MSNQLIDALSDCVSVMERELNGLAVIQPELKAAREALAAANAAPTAWPENGFPPVGTVCMTSNRDEELKVKILAYAGGADGRDYVLACNMLGDREDQLFGWISHMCEFWPVKSTEQIAAEKRKQEIDLLGLDMKDAEHVSYSVMAERLYALGYRKVEGGAA